MVCNLPTPRQDPAIFFSYSGAAEEVVAVVAAAKLLCSLLQQDLLASSSRSQSPGYAVVRYSETGKDPYRHSFPLRF